MDGYSPKYDNTAIGFEPMMECLILRQPLWSSQISTTKNDGIQKICETAREMSKNNMRNIQSIHAKGAYPLGN